MTAILFSFAENFKYYLLTLIVLNVQGTLGIICSWASFDRRNCKRLLAALYLNITYLYLETGEQAVFQKQSYNGVSTLRKASPGDPKSRYVELSLLMVDVLELDSSSPIEFTILTSANSLASYIATTPYQA